MESQKEFLIRFSEVRRQTLRYNIQESRKANDQFFYIPLAHREKVFKILDEKVFNPQGVIPIRIYIPKGTPPFPVLIFLHWGGWVFGNIENSDALCRKLCHQSNTIIISADYRLAPEHPYPAALEDCLAVVKWAKKHAQEFFGDPNRIGISGESAGGNLAAAVALYLRDHHESLLSLQLLICPLLSYDLDEKYFESCPDQEFLTLESTRWFWSQYLPEGKTGSDPYACPYDSSSFHFLPKTIIVTAGHDPLRQDGLKYLQCLKKDKVSVVSLDYPNALHGFLNLPIDKPIVEKAFEDISKLIKIYTIHNK